MTENEQTIGVILKTARQEQKLSLEDIATATRIHKRYLIAIEADNWDALPSVVQQKGFVRSFARAVGLDPTPLIHQLRLLLKEDQLDQDLDEVLDQSEQEIPKPDQPLIGDIGEVLNRQREKLGFTLSNVADQIYIPERYLRAIEEGRLEQLPSTVQGKGMLKNYAEFLGLDPDPLLLKYAEVLQSRREVIQEGLPGVPSQAPTAVWLRRFIASPTLLWVGAILLVGIISIWAGVLIFGGKETTPQTSPTVPAVADILLPSSTATATEEAPGGTPGDFEIDISATPGLALEEEGQNEITSTPGLTGNEKIQIQLVIHQQTWVRVTVDNIVAYQGRLLPGSMKEFGGELSIEVLTGNAAGIEVVYNQRNMGVMGLFGEVVDRVYTAEGVATPTPTTTLTPTPSDTPEPSLTPTPTLTEEGE